MKALSLPVIQCDEGCSDCCGPVLCKSNEYDAVIAYAKGHGIEPVDQGVTCPWFQGGRCSVYPVRPWICQMFGHSKKLVCSRGYNRNISTVKERKMRDAYNLNPDTARLLHEAIPGLAEKLGR